MKTIVIIFLTLIQFNCFCQIPEIQKLSTLCKVWGFLKYYHPNVTTGKIDWDSELVEKIKLIKEANNKEENNIIYSEWIKKLGKIKECKKSNYNVPDSLKYNLNIDWINDSSIFTNEMISSLNYIKENRSKKQGYYIRSEWMPSPDFGKENPYCEMIYPNEEYRLVGLFRYWNIINYFFPYKYVIGQNWNNVITELIPCFQNAKDTLEYHFAILELTTKVNDCHAGLYSDQINNFFGLHYPPFVYKIIDNKAIINILLDDSLAKSNDVLLGDVITKVNGKELEDVIKEKIKYIAASNEATKLRDLNGLLTRTNDDSIQITIERNGQHYSKSIKVYKATQFHYEYRKRNKVSVCKVLNENIGYINMGMLKKNKVDSVMKIMMNKKAIIFDVRNYPKGTLYAIAKYLNKENNPFVKFTKPDFSYPGVFKWTHEDYCGKDNPNYFKGKVVILFNEVTQSHAEFTCMALQTAPDVKSIGSHTAGADGNVTTIAFPGNNKVWMTGLGIYYPNGTKTQRIGLIPDIEIKPTIEGIRKGKDEVLDRAIEYINIGK